MVRWSSFSLNTLSGGLLVSLLLHGLIAALLLFDLARPMAEPEPQEEVVAVTIVPPPEPEPEPEPEPAPEPAAEAAPEPEPAETAAAEAAQPPELPEAGSVPIPVLRPVFEFGAEDAGPEIAPDGGAAQAPEAAGPEVQPEEPASEPEPETAAEAPPEAVDPAEEPAEDAAEEPAEDLAETPVEDPVEEPQQDAPAQAAPAEIAVPDEVLAGDQPGDLPDAADQTETALLPEEPAAAPPSAPEPVKPDPVKPDPVETRRPGSSSGTPPAAPAEPAPAVDNGLPGVRALSSSVNTGHAVATTAMGALPRDVRGTQLCTTELREQLRRAPESYRVELLPSYRLPGGNVLAVPRAAFRAGGAWYNLSFRCTVDTDALRVTDFSFNVGTPVPRAEWRQRGFPEL